MSSVKIQDRSLNLSPGDKELLIDYINNHPNLDINKKNSAIANLEYITFDPNYESKFTGNLFTGEDAKYNQARDKIDAFFKYGDDIVGGMSKGGRRSRRRSTIANAH
jgi:hypothetical protein